jgi:hypothetical protein
MVDCWSAAKAVRQVVGFFAASQIDGEAAACPAPAHSI